MTGTDRVKFIRTDEQGVIIYVAETDRASFDIMSAREGFEPVIVVPSDRLYRPLDVYEPEKATP